MRVLVTMSLVVFSLFFPPSHYLATFLEQPRKDWEKAWGGGGEWRAPIRGILHSEMLGAPTGLWRCAAINTASPLMAPPCSSSGPCRRALLLDWRERRALV